MFSCLCFVLAASAHPLKGGMKMHSIVRAILMLLLGSYAARNAREPGYAAGVLLGAAFMILVAFLLWAFGG